MTIANVLSGAARWCVVHGDNREVLPTIERVDHVISDPPYSAHVHGKSRAGARKTPLLDGNGRMSRCAIDREVDFGFVSLDASLRRLVASECGRLTKRWALFFCDLESTHLWRRSLEVAGFDYCRTCVWEKLHATPQFTGDRPAVAVEGIVTVHQPGRKRWNGGGSHGIFKHGTVQNRPNGTSGPADRCHPTQKPVSLMLELVELFTDPGDVVLDPFCGSGTTGVACLRLGRRFIGIELDETFANVARERLMAETNGSTLSAQRAGQEALFK